ncbi:unnamed protein product [Choristocarpus tenellus]
MILLIPILHGYICNRSSLEHWLVAGLTGVAPEDVIKLDTRGSVETQAYIITVDHKSHSIVLSIRGTYSVSDTVMCMLCTSVGVCAWTGKGGEAKKIYQMQTFQSLEQISRGGA